MTLKRKVPKATINFVVTRIMNAFNVQFCSLFTALEQSNFSQETKLKPDSYHSLQGQAQKFIIWPLVFIVLAWDFFYGLAIFFLLLSTSAWNTFLTLRGT